MIFKPKKIYFYIARNFLIKFLLVCLAITAIIWVISLFDIVAKDKSSQVKWLEMIWYSALQIPAFLENISAFLIALSTIIALFSLNLRSEITIIRVSGLSLWQILSPIIFCAFILGVLFITVINPLSIMANKKFNVIDQKLVGVEKIDLLSPKSGVWLKQKNIIAKDEEIIIRADSIYRNNLKLMNVNLWFFDKNLNCYQRISAASMLLKSGYWQLNDITINDDKKINYHQSQLQILTDLEANFITKKVLNNFEDTSLFSVYDLPNLIGELKQSGFSPRKFVVYYYSLLIKPILFVAMVLISSVFAINNTRGRSNILFFIIGVIFALTIHICLMVTGAIGAGGLMPEFLSTWVISFILLSLGMLLVFRKELST